MLEEAGGVFAFASPVGKPFIIAGGEEIVKDVLIHHASHYGKQHANGILEIFRKTALPTSGIPAWRPVHKIASRISRNSGKKKGGGKESGLRRPTCVTFSCSLLRLYVVIYVWH
jgi:hypothetical protein